MTENGSSKMMTEKNGASEKMTGRVASAKRLPEKMIEKNGASEKMTEKNSTPVKMTEKNGASEKMTEKNGNSEKMTEKNGASEKMTGRVASAKRLPEKMIEKNGNSEKMTEKNDASEKTTENDVFKNGVSGQDTCTLTLAELLDSNFLCCPSCQKSFQDPVLLPCLHSLCRTCATQLSTRSESEQDGQTLLRLVCPSCQSKITAPETGLMSGNPFLVNLCQVSGFKTPAVRECEYCKFDGKKITATTLCLVCCDDMCGPCSRAHNRTRVTRDHKLAPYEQIAKGLYDHDIRAHQRFHCKVHKEHDLTSLCEMCSVLICAVCKEEHHQDHKTSTVQTAFQKSREKLTSFLEGLNKSIPDIAEYADFLSQHASKVQKVEEDLTEKIQEQTTLLHKLIDQHKQRIVDQLTRACKEEVEKTHRKCSDMKTAETSLQQNADFLGQLVRFGKPEEVLSVQGTIVERLKQLVHMKPDGLSHRLVTRFWPGSPTEQNVQIMFGYVDIDRVPFDEEDSPAARMTIANVMPSVLESPTLVASFDTKLISDSADVWPTGLCLVDQDYVFVDRGNKKIKIFNKDGTLKSEFSGSDDHTLGSPYDATVLDDGNIAVTDHKSEDVKIFKLDGSCVLTISGHFRHPRGIATDKHGHLVVVDCHLHQVMTFDPRNGKLLHSFKAKDAKGGQLLTDPSHIAVTEVGDLVVSDQAAPNVKVFSARGQLLAQYGSYGTNQDQVLQPYGVCVDQHGYIFVADHQNSRIHMLLPDGRFSKFLVTKQDKLWHPVSLTLNAEGHLVVAEALGKVNIYKYI